MKIKKALKEIGLTEYESTAYLALVRFGYLTARKISEVTLIPYSKIYSVLDRLENKGWVDIRGGRPRKYNPRAPLDALRIEEIKIQNKFERIKELFVTELQPLYEQIDVREKPEIWIIRGVENIASTLKNISKRVKNELLIALPEISKELFPIIFPFLEPLRDRKVSIFLLTTEEIMSLLGGYISYLAEIRVRDVLTGGGIVIDENEALLFLGKDIEMNENLAIWSDHIGLTNIAKIYFEHLWETSKKYQGDQKSN